MDIGPKDGLWLQKVESCFNYTLPSDSYFLLSLKPRRNFKYPCEKERATRQTLMAASIIFERECRDQNGIWNPRGWEPRPYNPADATHLALWERCVFDYGNLGARLQGTFFLDSVLTRKLERGVFRLLVALNSRGLADPKVVWKSDLDGNLTAEAGVIEEQLIDWIVRVVKAKGVLPLGERENLCSKVLPLDVVRGRKENLDEPL